MGTYSYKKKILISKTNKKGGNQINYNIDNFQVIKTLNFTSHFYMLPKKWGTNSLIIQFFIVNIRQMFAARKRGGGVESPPLPSISCLNSTDSFFVLRITRTKMNFKIAEMIKIARVHLEIP